MQASFSNNQGPFHWRNRFLRIEEIKRIQTIDDDYEILGNLKNNGGRSVTHLNKISRNTYKKNKS